MKNINKEQYVMRKKINKVIMKRPQGFTLVETLLVVFFTSFAIMGVYMMQRKASDEVTVSKEKEYILTLFDQMDKTAASISRFQNVSLQTLKDNGYEIKTNGFNLTAISTPTATSVEAEYTGLTNKECSMFVSSMVNFSDNHSARINNIPIASKSNPEIITKECSADSNTVVIVRENNMFGVALNTDLNGINNPTLGQAINPCPTNMCNNIVPSPPLPPFPSTNVNITKPSVSSLTSSITNPTFNLASALTQPITNNPILTAAPPIVCWNGTIVLNISLCPPLPPPPPPPVTPTTPIGPATPVEVCSPYSIHLSYWANMGTEGVVYQDFCTTTYTDGSTSTQIKFSYVHVAFYGDLYLALIERDRHHYLNWKATDWMNVPYDALL